MTAMPGHLAPVGGAFELTDHNGQAVTDRSFRGRFLMIFFGFTHCKVVCPRALERLSDALDELGPMAARVQPLYVTVDPARDTPEQMRAFLAKWPRFIGLTGQLEQIVAMKGAFRVFAERRETDDGYDMPHTAITHLLDPTGAHVDHWPDVLSAGEVADRLFDTIQAYFHAQKKGIQHG